MSATFTTKIKDSNINIKDIAIKTGFSIKTVSRAINNHPDVNEETRKKILKVAKEYSYYPNLLAKSLRTKKAFTIGYIVPDITSEFFGKMGIVIENEFRKNGYGLLISFTEESREKEIDSLKLFLSKRVDGIILATVGTTGTFLKEIINQYKVPVVVIDNKEIGVRTNLVIHDNINGAYLLTEHLIGHGHKNIACITGPLDETSGKERLIGYKKALEKNNITIDDSIIKTTNWRIDDGIKTTEELMQNNIRKPTAIFSGNSTVTLGVYKVLKRMNLNIPNDVAIVSFDNFEFAEVLDPPLTTLDKIEQRIGKIASKLLLKKIKDKDVDNINEFLVKGKLIIRNSCGCK